MSVYEVGRIAVKSQGREAGLKCVVVDIIDRSYVLVDGVKVRRRRCNIKHLIPTPDKIEIEKGAEHDAVLKAIKKAKLTKAFEVREKVDL